ncbi:hypothetical protein AC1031_007756 [Aphanomyces cochlioides]|nr:hypothetical protein AC1031_007756 [Aphanomyces cochlioides]
MVGQSTDIIQTLSARGAIKSEATIQRQAMQPSKTTEPTITTAERKAIFAHIRKMPPWRERVAHCMKQRQERATLEDSDETADESVSSSSSSSGGSGEAYDEDYEVEFIEEEDEEEVEPPFLADLETLLRRRQVRLSHRAWVETDPLQVMFTDFYKLMEDVVDGRQPFSS